MPLPPEAIYSSQDELWQAIQAWGAQYNYGFRTGRSKTIGKSSRKKIIYICDRYGDPPSETSLQEDPLQARKRRTTTRKTGCMFSIIAKEIDSISWILQHRIGAHFNIRNHLPSLSAASHPKHRKFTQEDIEKAKQLYNAGIYYSI
jgi:hypothetical protein